LRLGAFVGAGETRSSVDFNYGDTKGNTVFAGMYAHYSQGALFAQAVLQGGHSINDSSRNINNNLVPGGLEVAKASYGTTYFSPEANLGLNFALGSLHGASYTLTPSVNVRYLFAAVDGYTETGSTANLSVASRNVQDVEERGQLKLTSRTVISANKVLLGSIYGGVLGVQRMGNTTINATLLGQEIPFATPGNSNVLGGFGGFGIEWHGGHVILFGSVEYADFSDSSSVISGRGGVKVAF
jgi:outer membrane autotransporter protein